MMILGMSYYFQKNIKHLNLDRIHLKFDIFIFRYLDNFIRNLQDYARKTHLILNLPCLSHFI